MARAARPISVRSDTLTPLGYQQITSATLVAATPLTVPPGAIHAIIQNNGTANVRYRDDDVDPTAALGQRLPKDKELWYEGDLTKLKLIREADGAILDIHYYA